MFSDLALSRRLERAEGYACAQFADARRRLLPHSRPSSRKNPLSFGTRFRDFTNGNSVLRRATIRRFGTDDFRAFQGL
jgi:hypothetical protein